MKKYFEYNFPIPTELTEYLPPLTKKNDFDLFWNETILENKKSPLNPKLTQVDYVAPQTALYDIVYQGFQGTPIHGWYLTPREGHNFPCILFFHGFNGHRGFPAHFLQYVNMGFAVLSIDIRDQGGLTSDGRTVTTGTTGNLTSRGILDKYEYYYRAVYMDCLKAIDFVWEQEEIDKSRIITLGGSQGGALSIATSALDSRIFLTIADVPSNSNLEARVNGENGAFAAVAQFLKCYPQQYLKAFDTLSYFDTMNMADRIKSRVFASVGGKDPVCPAKTFMATYNRITTEKELKYYPFNGHEGGGSFHNELVLDFLNTYGKGGK